MIRTFVRIGAAAALLVPTSSFAIDVTIYCGNLPGCGSGFEDFLTSAVNLILNYLPMYIIALAATFVLIGGMTMILNLGNEQHFETGKKTVIWALGGLAIAVFSRDLIDFVMGERYIDPTDPTFTASDTVLGILYAVQRIILVFFNTALVAAILFHSVRLITTRGNEEEYNKAIRGFFYSAIGAIVINLTQYLVDAVRSFFV